MEVSQIKELVTQIISWCIHTMDYNSVGQYLLAQKSTDNHTIM